MKKANIFIKTLRNNSLRRVLSRLNGSYKHFLSLLM